MKKKYPILLLTFAMCFALLAGCDASQDSVSTPDSESMGDSIDGSGEANSETAPDETEETSEDQVAARLTVSVRLKGEVEWLSDVLEAEIGDEIEYQIEFINLTDQSIENVMIRDILPTNVEYVDNSTILFNSNYQDGVLISENTVTSSGINIGSYNSQGNAYVRFTGKIVDNTLADGSNQLVNWANVTLYGITGDGGLVYNDDVSVMVYKAE